MGAIRLEFSFPLIVLVLRTGLPEAAGRNADCKYKTARHHRVVAIATGIRRAGCHRGRPIPYMQACAHNGPAAQGGPGPEKDPGQREYNLGPPSIRPPPSSTENCAPFVSFADSLVVAS